MVLEIARNLNNYFSTRVPGMVMKTSLLVSFFFHIIILILFQKTFLFQWEIEPPRLYQVELIRPPVEEIDDKVISGSDLDLVKQKEDTTNKETEDTISLDTKDKRYISYANLIKNEIAGKWRYPPEARAYLIEGDLIVLFSLTRDGRLSGIEIIKSSGYEILDKEVIRAINSAAPFPSFPGSITVKKLNIKAAFDYRLTTVRREKQP